MHIELKDYEHILKALAWKFRNLGFADALYAPVTDTSSEGKSQSKMANIEEGCTKKKAYRYTVNNFEDLLSEAYVVFVELKNKWESGDVPDGINFQQALITRLQSHYTDLYKSLLCIKRAGDVRPLTEEDSDTIPFSEPFITKLNKDFRAGHIPEPLQSLAKDVLEGKLSHVTKKSLFKYLNQKGMKYKDFCDLFAT